MTNSLLDLIAKASRTTQHFFHLPNTPHHEGTNKDQFQKLKNKQQITEVVGERSKKVSGFFTKPAFVSPAMHPERMSNRMRLPFTRWSISPSD
jgi:hypothetical protein